MIYSILEKFRNKNHVIWSSYAKDMRETSKQKKKKKKNLNGPAHSDRPEQLHARTYVTRFALKSVQNEFCQTYLYSNCYNFLSTTPNRLPFVSTCSLLQGLSLHHPKSPYKLVEPQLYEFLNSKSRIYTCPNLISLFNPSRLRRLPSVKKRKLQESSKSFNPDKPHLFSSTTAGEFRIAIFQI